MPNIKRLFNMAGTSVDVCGNELTFWGMCCSVVPGFIYLSLILQNTQIFLL